MFENAGENKSNKLSTIICTSILIIMLIILIVWITLLYNKIKELDSKIKDLTTTISSLEYEKQNMKKIIDEELGEEYLEINNAFDKIDEIINEENVSYNDEDVKDFSDDVIKEAISNYIEIADLYNTSKKNLLLKLGLTNSKKIENYGGKVIGNEYYYSTDIRFEDYKNAMLQYMNEECFKDNFCDEVKSLDGILYYSYYESSDPRTHEIISLTKDEYEQNSFNVILKEKTHYEYEGTDEEDEEEILFTITSKDGKAIVEYTDFLI